MRPSLLRNSSRIVLCTVVAGATLVPTVAFAQACHGTPSGTSIGFEHGTYQLGTSNGLAATFAGSRFAAGVDAAMRDYSSDFSGQQGSVRLSLVLGSRFQVCPGLRLGGARDTWEYQPGAKITGTTLGASGGVNIGMEQHVAGDFSLIPFVGASYRFAATAFSIGAPNSENAVGGDTVSTVFIEYGLVGRFRFVYGGLALERTSDDKDLHPSSARWIIGISLTNLRGGGDMHSSAIDKPRRR